MKIDIHSHTGAALYIGTLTVLDGTSEYNARALIDSCLSAFRNTGRMDRDLAAFVAEIIPETFALSDGHSQHTVEL